VSDFNYAALIVARESRGRTQADVARAAGISQGLISKAENGIRPLSREHAEKVADHLGYPATLFYESGPIFEGRSGCLYHRKRKTLPAKTLDLLEGRMGIRLINTRHLLHGLEIIGERAFHTLDPEEFGGPENVAVAFRRAWRVPPGPIRDLVALVESAGAIIVMSSFGTQKLFGMSQWTTRDHPLFFLNADTPMEELRWTIAHELAHLTMHGTPTNGDPEQEADAFAGEFLAPRSLILPDLRGLTFGRLPALKMHWRLSMKALIKRAEVLGAVSRQDAVRLYKQYSARRYNNAEPYPLPVETPTLVREAARVHLEEHGYTLRELADAARLTEDELLGDLLGDTGGEIKARPLSLVRD
jgi:Zn-dependent peptidase ImmA (M78 family)/transcriptional regulator with XRE-family HTH domain